MKKIRLYSEHDLACRLKEGDQFAFEVIFYKYKDRLKGFIIQIVPSWVDAEEIIQQVFIKLWIKRETIDETKSLSSFLHTIAKNQVIDQLKSSINSRIYFAGNDFVKDFDYSEPVSNDNIIEIERKILALIDKLPEKRKRIFTMSRLDGLTYKQIASELNISENTVDSQIRHALNFIREEIKRTFIYLLLLFSR